MGTTPDFFTPAIGWRAEVYYGWNMGGASINGINFGNIKKAIADSLRGKDIDQSATFEVTSNTLDPNRTRAEITVKVTASKDLPEGIKLHSAVVETDLDIVAVYGQPTGNGQTHIYNIVRDLLTDSAGVAIAALTNGQSHFITKTFVRDTAFQKSADSLRVVAWLQNDTSKQIIAAMQASTSAIPHYTAILGTPVVMKNSKLMLVQTGKKSVSFTMPFDGVKAAIFNTFGRTLSQVDLNSKKGEKVSLNLPESQNIVFLKLVSAHGAVVITKIMLK